VTATDPSAVPAPAPLAPPLPDGLDTPCLVVDLDLAEGRWPVDARGRSQ
jgi:hypothetical protein